MRFIFLIILLYLLYRFIRALFYPSTKRNIDTMRSNERPEEDEMVMDPYCETYVPIRNSYSAKINGESLYFCSTECLEKYKQEKAQISK
jgi:YHS domain-containing protein